MERALTPGKGHPSFGVSAATTSFSELDGKNLRDGSPLTISNQFRDRGCSFDTENLTLKIRTSGMTLFGSVPVTDHFEIGAALPLVRLGAGWGTGHGAPRHDTRSGQRPGDRKRPRRSGVTRQGDACCSTKRGFGIAAAAELRAPTARSGTTCSVPARLAIVSPVWRPYEPSHFAVHLNLGWRVGESSNEVSLSAAGLVARQSPRDAFR